MIPKLYESTEMEFVSNGLGSLPDAISCKVTEERNGCYELEMEYPVGGLHYDLIENNRIIYAKPNETSDPQPFDIKEITPSMNKMTATIYAQHVRYRMNGIPVSPFSAQGINDALAGLKQNSLIKHPFTFYTDIVNGSSKFNVGLPGTLGSLLGGKKGSILDTFSGSAGCEYEFDRFNVKLHAHRGTDSGVSIRYAKNLTGCKMESSIESVYTGVLAYWQKKGEDKEELLSSDIQYIANHASYPREYIYMLDCSSDFEDTPTVEQLNAKASDYAVNNRIGEPSVSVDVSFIPLWGTEEYKAIAPLERTCLCDTVTVRFDLLGVNVKAIVNKTVYDVLSEKYESISIGSAKSKLGETIKQEVHNQAEAVKKDTISAVQGSIDKAVDKIRGGTDGHVILSTNANGETNEVYAYDGNSLETAAKVLRLNYEGLAGTDKGINGNYNVAITTDGQINASSVKFGELDGNLIKAKSLQIGSFDEETENTITSSLSQAVTEWYVSTSPTELNGGSWSESRPAWTENNYIWQRLRTENKKGEISYSEPSCVQGNTGAKGDKGEQGERGLQGIQGERGEQGVPGKDGSNGANGKTSYFHIKYSSVANPTSSSQMTETPNTYIGTYVDYTEADSSDPSKYTWSRFQGIQGDKGIPGTNGTNGKTSYLHIAYANSADGKTGFDVSNSANKLYIGQYTDFNPTDSTDHTRYSWSKIKGDKGDKGNDGTSVKITAKSVTYQASTSGTTTPTGAWVANPPTVAKGQYLWTKTVVTYSDGNSTTAYSVAYQGTNGANGQNGSNGRGVKSTEVTYQIWYNGTSTPNGTWQTTVPGTTADKPYLWTRTIITYTDDTKSTSFSVGSTLKGVNVGGRNLLLNSRIPKNGTYYILNDLNSTENLFKNCRIFSAQKAWGGLRVFFNKHVTERNVVHVGDKLTYSIYAKTDNISPISIMMFNRAFNDSNGRYDFDSSVRQFTLRKEWAQYSLTFTVTDSILKTSGTGMTYFGFEILTENTEEGKYVYFACPKLELGNIATDWTPAPEDVDADISNAQTTANSAQSSADKANTSASNAQQSANSAQNTANNASTKADQAISDAASANAAAQKAKDQADKAQKDSDAAKALATNAWNDINDLEQVVIVDSSGVRVLESKNSKNYSHIKSDGMHVFNNGNDVAQFGQQSKMNNMAVKDYIMFGAHRAELLTINEEQGTAFYWIGDIQ